MTNRRDTAFRKTKTLNIVNPIKGATTDGIFKMTATSLEKYKSNLYTLLFTGVGERVMEPDFGTLLKYMLFEPLTEDIEENIKREIIQKTAFYIPEILIQRISFDGSEEALENNKIALRIDFILKTDPTIKDFVELEIGI